MELLIALTIGVLVSASVYALLQRKLLRFLIGIALLSQAINLIVFVSGGILSNAAPIIPKGLTQFEEGYADPLPQALVLTAIVIGFGLLVFTLSLAFRAKHEIGSDDIESYRSTDK